MSEQAAEECVSPAGAPVLPCAPFVGAAVFGIVVELGEALLELRPDSTILQIRHGHFVLLLHKRLSTTRRHKEGQVWKVLFRETLYCSCCTMVSVLSGSSSQAYGSQILVPWYSSTCCRHKQVQQEEEHKQTQQQSVFGTQTGFSWQTEFSQLFPLKTFCGSELLLLGLTAIRGFTLSSLSADLSALECTEVLKHWPWLVSYHSSGSTKQGVIYRTQAVLASKTSAWKTLGEQRLEFKVVKCSDPFAVEIFVCQHYTFRRNEAGRGRKRAVEQNSAEPEEQNEKWTCALYQKPNPMIWL